MSALVDAVGRFVTACWDAIAALHRLLAALAKRDIEAFVEDRRMGHPWFNDYDYACEVVGQVPIPEQRVAFDAVAVSRKARGR